VRGRTVNETHPPAARLTLIPVPAPHNPPNNSPGKEVSVCLSACLPTCLLVRPPACLSLLKHDFIFISSSCTSTPSLIVSLCPCTFQPHSVLQCNAFDLLRWLGSYISLSSSSLPVTLSQLKVGGFRPILLQEIPASRSRRDSQ
jgi:hypothetical protein